MSMSMTNGCSTSFKARRSPKRTRSGRLSRLVSYLCVSPLAERNEELSHNYRNRVGSFIKTMMLNPKNQVDEYTEKKDLYSTIPCDVSDHNSLENGSGGRILDQHSFITGTHQTNRTIGNRSSPLNSKGITLNLKLAGISNNESKILNSSRQTSPASHRYFKQDPALRNNQGLRYTSNQRERVQEAI